MADLQVKYANKTKTAHEHITHLGGDTWTWTKAAVIASIEAKSNTFYVSQNGKRASIGVVNGAGGKYLRTYANGAWTDNLLSLPPCVAAVAA